MNRRTFVSMLGGGLAGMNAPSLLAQTSTPASSGKPNFLFLIADDLTYRTINAINNTEVHTPNLDRLSKSGCTFTHCFHQGGWSPAVCVPSRTMLNSGLTTFRAEDGIEHVPTWGQTMGAGGYDTFIAGKWHLSAPALARSFKELGMVAPGFLPSTQDAYNRPSPGNTWEPWDTSLKGHWLHTDLWGAKTGKGHWPHSKDYASQGPDEIEHSSVAYADCAIDYLTHHAATRTTPFFMYVGFNAPHDPRQAPKEYVDRYPQDKIEIPPNFLPEHPFNEGMHHLRDETLSPFPRTKEAVQLHRSEYYAIITHMDEQIGRILDALQASGKAANTYIIMTADHGLCVGEHGLMGKQNQYDASQRMPLMIAGPGIEAGRVVEEAVYQHSMYATTCELAGLAVPSTVEFPSIASMLHGEVKPLYDATFCWYMGFQRAVRTKTHKLIFYPQLQRTQVFDLANDPWETKDLADDPAAQTVKAELWARLLKFQHELGDTLDLLHPAPISATKDT